MNYYQVSCPKPQEKEQTEILIAELVEVGFESFEETDTRLLAYFPEEGFDPKLIANIEFCKKMQKQAKVDIQFIPDQNWNALWESNYPPVLIADRCYIRAPFHEEKKDVDFSILIKPKMAFGTAHHETTAQIISLMLDDDFEAKQVLDMGCGTGVLAILASLKGAAHVDAVDNDPWSFNNTSENIELNPVKGIRPVLGDASALTISEQYDIILANINKNILVRDMEAYVAALKKGGKIYFSGFYAFDLTDIQQNAKSLGLVYQKHTVKNDWVAALFYKS